MNEDHEKKDALRRDGAWVMVLSKQEIEWLYEDLSKVALQLGPNASEFFAAIGRAKEAIDAGEVPFGTVV